MSDNPVKEVLNDMLGHIESLETQTRAILQFLKDRGTVTDEQLAPYLEQAGKASEVRMRAARARMEHLLTTDDKAKPATAAAPPAPDKQTTQTTLQPANTEQDKQKSAPQTSKIEASKSTTAAKPEAKEKPKPAPQQSEKEPSEITAGRGATKSAPPNKVEEKSPEPNPRKSAA